MANENELNEDLELEDLDSLLAMVDEITDEDADGLTAGVDYEVPEEEFDMAQLLGGLDDSSVEEDGEEVFSLDELLQQEEAEENGFLDETLALEEEEDVLVLEEIEELGSIPDVQEMSDMQTAEVTVEEAEPVKKKEKKEKEKPGVFQKLFGNVKDKKTARKAAEAAAKEAARYDENGVPVKKLEKAKKREEAKEAREAKKALKKEADKVKQQEKIKLKEAKKKQKAEKRKQEEEDIDPGRINRIGATIVFGFFALFTLVTILGTDSFSYNSNISRAQEKFSEKQYTEAYDSMNGMDLEDADMEIHDKVMTVMFVNKQLNSYNNYYDMEMYPEALDSLLKGLKRYDEYITTATELGVAQDLNSIKEQIVKELKDIFNLSEQEAYQIIDSDTQESYSQQVINKAAVLSAS